MNESPPATVNDQNPQRSFLPLKLEQADGGYALCRKYVKQQFSDRLWTFMNLPRAEQSAIYTLLYVIDQGWEVYRSRSFEAVGTLRDNLNDAFCGRYISPEWLAVHHAQHHFQVRRQFYFDFVEGIDHAIRFGQPQTFADVQTLATRLGGSWLCAAIQIMGTTRDGFESLALQMGQTLLIAEWLFHAPQTANRGIAFLAQEDLNATECPLSVLAGPSFQKPAAYLVRLYAHRLEGAFQSAAPLLNYLDFDCGRVVRGLISSTWQTLVKLRYEPSALYAAEGAVSQSERLGQRTRYFLGLESELPFELPHDSSHH